MSRHPDTDNLRELVLKFIRRFGLLDQNSTPCGHPMPVGEAHALMEIMKSPRIRQIELAGRLGLSKSATSRLVGRLERRGAVRRARDGDDGRAQRLSLSAKGRTLATHVNGSSLDLFSRLVSSLPDGKREQLFEGLSLLVAAIPDARRICISDADPVAPEQTSREPK